MSSNGNEYENLLEVITSMSSPMPKALASGGSASPMTPKMENQSYSSPIGLGMSPKDCYGGYQVGGN